MQAAAVARAEAEGRLAASPFVKWAGGKGQLLSQLEPFFPPPGSYRRYFEPFLGGGAVFFHLQPPRAVLSDLNDELINAYEVIRDNLDELLDSMRKHKDDTQYFYWVRALAPDQLNPVRRASRFIFLNKRCYNGLYRVNSKGLFNVPVGRYKNPPRIFDEANLRNISRLLQPAELRVASYELALARAGAGDFVYLDPPYQPLSATANFTRYTRASFDEADQARLAQVLQELDARGAKFLLNNHDTRQLRRMYNGFHIEKATANRMINSRADRRRGVAELIVTNYEPEPDAR
ncbi:MAG TPA: DNA adenine methylase [Chloroflexota bacterium]|nr:DNA adenine methylase [Chloroflexota bacterium]